MRGILCAIGVALAFLFAPASTALASTPTSTVQSQPASTQNVDRHCCASAWYGWGYYPTEAACKAKGKEVVRTVPVALKYKCIYGQDNHRTEWKLYILEAG